MRLLLSAGLLWIAGPLAAAQPIHLVENGQSAYSICIARDASPSERRGAGELQRFLHEMSGARLPIVEDGPEARRKLVFVGNSGAAARRKLNAPAGALGAEGFVLKTAGDSVFIAGGRLRGTMYGVYTFLEKLGCRWFTGEVSRIPKLRTITVGPLDETQKPAFEYREPFITEAFDKDWAARNKMNGAHMRLDESTGGRVEYFPFVHTFYKMIPPEKHFQAHPEYFSLIDGKRRVERGQLCLTNPDVLRLSVEAVLEWIRQHPEATIYSVSQNDWDGWCECDKCRRVEREEGGAHSGPILRFVNALAAEVEKKHPGKLIDTLAYMYSEAPPLLTRPRSNVRIRLCPIGVCEAHPYEKCPYNAYFLKNLRAWSKITDRLYVWHYNTNFSNYLLPFPDFDELAADLPMYRRHGVVGLFLEGAYPPGGGGEMGELRAYVTARLLWDTAAGPEKAITEFLEAVYGPAAGPMQSLFDLLHRLVRMPPAGEGQHIWIRRSPHLSDAVISQAQELFRQAETAAGSEAVLERVRKARLSLDAVELLLAKRFAVKDGMYTPANLDGLQQRFRQFMSDLRRFGVTSITEGVSLEDDEREFAARIRPYRPLTLENASVSAVIVPELDGRIVRWIDKKSGKDALRPPDVVRNYPNLGGLAVFALPEAHTASSLEIQWEAAATRPGEVVLAGLARGLEFRRTVRLAGDSPGLRAETRVTNRTPAAVDLILAERVIPNPGGALDLDIAYRKPDGTAVAQTLFRPGDPPAGTAAYGGPDCPDGEWRLISRGAGITLRIRFPRDQVERCSLNWRARGEDRVTASVLSHLKRLEPGGSLVLETEYTVE
ncbi:MAG: DUF4838 domain-containing protein [Acidobacteria bacterium]|nr:DUF4838 domain-containing protein [Acidobacteriota bacterium]